jgi:drug/metabolite transporter (DMT)-like permease
MVSLGFVQIAVPYACVYWGEQYVTSGLASILGATIPFFTAMVAHVLRAERLTFRSMFGIIVGFVGLSFVFSNSLRSIGIDAASIMGQLAILTAAASSGFAYVIGRSRSTHLNSVVNVTVQLGTGAIFLSIIALATEHDFPATVSFPVVASLLYLSLVGSALAFVLLYWLLKRMPATQAGMIALVNHAVALALGWIFLGENVTWTLLLGAALIIWGIYAVMSDRLLPRFTLSSAA